MYGSSLINDMNPPPLSMIFIAVSVLVPFILVCGVPHLIEQITKRKAQSFGVLALAAFLFFISWYLPSPLIEGRYTAFTTHVVGGGMFTALLARLDESDTWWDLLANTIGSFVIYFPFLFLKKRFKDS